MPKLSGTAVVKGFSKVVSCSTAKIIQLGIISGSDVDLANIADTDEEITALPLQGGAAFEKMHSKVENASVVYTYDETSGYYSTVLTIDMGGFSKEIRDAALNNQSFCDLIFWVHPTDNQYRFIGLDKVGSTWQQLLQSKSTGHVGTIGGQSESSNIVTFTTKSYTAPPYTTVDDTVIFPSS